jgi:DNA-binding winged helix-turn-helix (wHTH) protein
MTTETHLVSGPTATSFVFGPFRLLPMERLLTRADKPVRLGSRAFDILIGLLERAGELVSKEELVARAWPNTFVASANLAVHISALRRALGDGGQRNRYIVNVPGRGYRFVAVVTVEKDTPAEAAAAVAGSEHDLPAQPDATDRARRGRWRAGAQRAATAFVYHCRPARRRQDGRPRCHG